MLDAQLGDSHVERRRQEAERDLRRIADVQLDASRPIARQSPPSDHIVRSDRQLDVEPSREDVARRTGDETRAEDEDALLLGRTRSGGEGGCQA